MNSGTRKRLAATLVGAVLVVAGGRIVDNISGAGGNLIPPIIALGILMLLVGSGAVVGCCQRLVGWRRFVGYTFHLGGLGLFALGGVTFVLSAPDLGRSPIAVVFVFLSAMGMAVGPVVASAGNDLLEGEPGGSGPRSVRPRLSRRTPPVEAGARRSERAATAPRERPVAELLNWSRAVRRVPPVEGAPGSVRGER